MIVQIEGQLLKLNSETALVQVGQLGYEIMLPGYCVSALSGKIGRDITLCTMQYMEGNPTGGAIYPRMIGFLSPSEKDFFAKFISVKGIGVKKGLRCLSIPIANIALAIENGDEKALLPLPNIGKRLAQQIIAELKGKLGAFAAEAVPSSAESKFDTFQTEALEILIAWGEKRSEAMELISLASKRHPEVTTAEELVPLVYRIKQGIEV